MATRELAEALEDRWVRVGDWDVHLLASSGGDRKPIDVLLLIGFVVGGHSAVPITVELARDYNVYTPDLPGYAKSTKPPSTLTLPEQAEATARLLDALGLRKVALIGNSFSAQIAAEFSMRHPERVDRLVLIGPGVDPRARTPFHQLWRFARNSMHENAVLPGMVGDYVDLGLRRIIATARYALRDRIEEKLPRIPMPALVVRGGEDAIVPQRWAEEAARLLPNGRLVVIPGYAHGVERVGAPTLAQVLRPFLDESLA